MPGWSSKRSLPLHHPDYPKSHRHLRTFRHEHVSRLVELQRKRDYYTSGIRNKTWRQWTSVRPINLSERWRQRWALWFNSPDSDRKVRVDPNKKRVPEEGDDDYKYPERDLEDEEKKDDTKKDWTKKASKGRYATDDESETEHSDSGEERETDDCETDKEGFHGDDEDKEAKRRRLRKKLIRLRRRRRWRADEERQWRRAQRKRLRQQAEEEFEGKEKTDEYYLMMNPDHFGDMGWGFEGLVYGW